MPVFRSPARLLLAVLLAGCAASPVGPPTIRYGTSPCAECHMLINEARFAAVALTGAGEPVLFDSTECLARYFRRHGALSRVWVHDYGSDRWLAAEDAFYVVSSKLMTPMGQGIVATASTPEANRLAGAVHGRVLRFAQLTALIDSSVAANEQRSP